MIYLSAFADEISPDPGEQARALVAEDIRHVDLRGAWQTNVLDLSDEQVAKLGRIFGDAGIRVAAIASPIGKTSISRPAEEEYERLDRAIALAHAFETPFIRVFSFYGPERPSPDWPHAYRDEVLGRVGVMARTAERAGITLVHENEREIFGDTIDRCVDLLDGVNATSLRAAFDPANFIQCGQTPYPDGYDALAPRIAYLHVKDATAGGEVKPAGEGVARFPDLLQRLREDGFEGPMALEPHLAEQGRLSGYSGPDLFRVAAQALKSWLKGMEWTYG
jgi:3-dehydroshikimate dehydratase